MIKIYILDFISGEEQEEEDECDSTSCGGCMNLIDDDEFFSAVGQDWHTECFR